MVKIKILVETYLSGEKRYINTLAKVEKLSSGLYKVESADGEYSSNSDRFNPIDRAFYTD